MGAKQTLEFLAGNPPQFVSIEGPHEEESARWGWNLACEAFSGVLKAHADLSGDDSDAPDPSEIDVTEWVTIAEEQSPSPNDVTVFTQFMRHGPHYLYRCVRTTSDGTILDITPLGCLDRDAVNP